MQVHQAATITSGLFSSFWKGNPIGVTGRTAEAAKDGSKVPRSNWRWTLVFLPSEATTVCLLLWAAGKFYDIRILSPSTGVGALLAWIAVMAGASALERWLVHHLVGLLRGLALGLGVAAVVWWVQGLAPDLAWTQLGAIGLMLMVALTVMRWLLAWSLNRDGLEWAEGFRWALLQGVAVFAVHPYIRSALVGAGDAYNYGLTLADYVGQAQAGIAPIFVGQTEFAFNGNIHPLRTAPYLAHLGGLLDLLTLRTLPAYALLNLVVVASAAVGTVGALVALCFYSRKRPWMALALAALYALSPAFLALLYEGDMIPTFLTLPMIPWLALGLALMADDPDEWRSWLIQGGALAALWWAHPPIAFWASALCAGAWVAILLRRGVTVLRLTQVATAAILCAVLALYEFTSVLTLQLPPGPDTQAGEAWSIVTNIRHYWRDAFAPMSPGGDSLLGDVQVGYSLILCLLGGVLIPAARTAARFLFVGVLGVLIFLVPVPGVTPWLWAHVPRAALDVTNAWPMQRLYPLAAGLVLLAAWAGLSEIRFPNRRAAVAAALAMLAGVAWSTREAQKLFRHANLMRRTPEQSALLYGPGNITLTRVSYMFFGHTPGYFSNGPMNPVLETRLLDARTFEVVADGTSRLGPDSASSPSAEMTGLGNGLAQLTIPMRPWEAKILRFDFHGRQPVGELQVTSRSMFGLYTLPSSGGVKSFGALSTNSRAIEIRNGTGLADSVSVLFVPDRSSSDRIALSEAFARVTIEPVTNARHVIELRSLLPFHVSVQAANEAILETPKMDIPGYWAFVNGLRVETVRTVEGLVGVPLPAGRNDVRLEYRGGAGLRWAYGISVVSWLGLFAGTLVVSFSFRSEGLGAFLAKIEIFARRVLPPTLATAAICGGLIFGLPWLVRRTLASEAGARRLIVMLPLGRAGQAEPLIETGRAGAGDVVYVRFQGGNRVSVGYDKWSLGASESEVFEADFTRPQTIDIAMSSLARRGFWGRAGRTPHGVSVEWNGREVLSVQREPYPRGAHAVEIGRNPLGATSCSATFTGKILSIAADEKIGP